MRSEGLEAIVLKRVNSGEADKLLTVFSKSKGKIKILAKGTRRIKSRRAPHLELFNYLDLQIHQGKGIAIVTEASVINSYDLIKTNLERSALTFYLIEVVDRLLPEAEPHPDVFVLVINSLKGLNNSALNRQQASEKVKSFVVSLLWELGFIPRGEYPQQGITNFVESLIERPLKSRKFLDEI